mmetsp:Transcript_53827/g.135944  ORF Transcript_53827/g.135944 Transcript_53827/m.135944 type:complete len:218 (+) Transcript_53827:299-952(+)
MHANVEPCEEALANCAEGPLSRGHDATHNTMAFCEDDFAEAQNATLNPFPVCGLEVSCREGLELPENEGYLASLSKCGTHVGIHHLNVMASCKAKCAELIRRLALGLEVICAYPQRVAPRQDFYDLERPVRESTTCTHTALVPCHDGSVLRSIPPQTDGREHFVHGALDEARDRLTRLLAVIVEDQEHWKIFVSLQQVQNGIVVRLNAVLAAKCLVS